MKEIEGTVKIGRTIGNYKTDKPIVIEVLTDEPFAVVCIVRMSFENYAKATTGMFVDCEIEMPEKEADK